MSVLPFYRTQLCASPTFAEMPARILLPPEEAVEPPRTLVRIDVSDVSSCVGSPAAALSAPSVASSPEIVATDCSAYSVAMPTWHSFALLGWPLRIETSDSYSAICPGEERCAHVGSSANAGSGSELMRPLYMTVFVPLMTPSQKGVKKRQKP